MKLKKEFLTFYGSLGTSLFKSINCFYVISITIVSTLNILFNKYLRQFKGEYIAKPNILVDRVKVSLVFVLFFNISFSLAQSSGAKLAISFGNSISENVISPKKLKGSNWIIKDGNNQNILSKGQGESLLEYIFEQPGDYQIYFSFPNQHEHTEVCNHPSLPEKVLLTVNDKSIKYFVDEVKLSENIKAGVDASDITLSIPIEIKTYKDELVEIPIEFVSSGINTTIIGVLNKNQRVLGSGRYVLNYNLAGVASKDTYISFDFLDFNGNNQVFYYLEKIN